MTIEDAVIDEAMWAELVELGRELDQDVVGEVVTTYRKLLPELLQEIERAATAHACEALVHAAHTLKGASAQIGAFGVRDAARSLEVAARDARFDGVEALVAACHEACARADAELARRVVETP